MEHHPPFRPGTELFRWGPVPGKWLYTSTFVEVIQNLLPKKYGGARWPHALYLFWKGRMVWINEQAAIQEAGRELFQAWILEETRYQEMRKEWHTALANLKEVESEVDALNLEAQPDEAIIQLWTRLHEAYQNFWLPTILPELGNYGSEPLLREYLQDHIEKAQYLA